MELFDEMQDRLLQEEKIRCDKLGIRQEPSWQCLNCLKCHFKLNDCINCCKEFKDH